jgi:cytochrome c oxidase subunit 2
MSIYRRRRLLILGAAASGLASLAPFVLAQPEERVLKLTAQRFSFSPGAIQLKQGVPTVLELTSLDIIMGFNAPDFGVRADVFPGRVSRVRIVPERAGQFVFHCDIFCGAGHEDMAGVIVVS